MSLVCLLLRSSLEIDRSNMESLKTSVAAFLLLLGILVGLMASPSQGYVFYAGGIDGWVLSHSEGYSHWAGRNRFQVNDTIVFKYYKKGGDLHPGGEQGHYDSCNAQNLIGKMDGGNLKFILNRSGRFYFMSGVQEDCNKGQKLTVLVMSARRRKLSLLPSRSPVSSPPPSSSSASVPSPSPLASSPAPVRRPSPTTPPSPKGQPPAQGSPPSAPSPAPAPSIPNSTSSVFRVHQISSQLSDRDPTVGI